MMRTKYLRPQILLLVVVNTVLASLLGYEVMALRQQQPTVTAAAQKVPELTVATKGKSGAPRAVKDYAEIINRPLFNMERRPLVQEESELSEEEARAFTLIGVVITPEQQVAILYSRSQQLPIKVAQWDWIEGWRLISIKANGVELRKGKNTLDLTLQRNSQKDADK